MGVVDGGAGGGGGGIPRGGGGVAESNSEMVETVSYQRGDEERGHMGAGGQRSSIKYYKCTN